MRDKVQAAEDAAARAAARHTAAEQRASRLQEELAAALESAAAEARTAQRQVRVLRSAGCWTSKNSLLPCLTLVWCSHSCLLPGCEQFSFSDQTCWLSLHLSPVHFVRMCCSWRQRIAASRHWRRPRQRRSCTARPADRCDSCKAAFRLQFGQKGCEGVLAGQCCATLKTILHAQSDDSIHVR